MQAGLSQGYVADMVQDRRGFMWFGTQDGLNRWDGHEMKIYNHQPFDKSTLSSGWIFGLDEDADGNIWLATNSGLNKLNPVTDEVEFWIHDPDDPSSLPADNLNDVLVGSDGTIWIGTQNAGLLRMRPEQPGIFHLMMNRPGDPTSLSHNKVYRVTEDSRGRIWVGGPRGINRLEDHETDKFTRFLSEPLEQDCGNDDDTGFRGVGGLLERREEPGIGWLGAEGALIRLDLDTGDPTLFSPDENQSCFGVFDPVQDPLNPGVLWMGRGGNGLSRFDIRTQSFQHIGNESDKSGSLPDGFTENTYVDRSGIVWVGTSPNGVSYFDPASVGVGLYTVTEGDPTSLGGALVTGIAQGEDGVVWVIASGENGWGLTELDRARNAARHYRHDPDDPGSISPGEYWGSVAVAPNGDVWVGPSGGGLDRLDRSTGRFEHFRHNPDDQTSLGPGRVIYQLVDRTGILWLAGRGALDRMDSSIPGVFHHYRGVADDPNAIYPTLIRSLSEDRAGFIWLAQQGGVSRLDPITGRATRWTHDPDDPSTLASPNVSNARERRVEPGVVWVTMYGGGLDRLDVESGEIRHFTEREGLANNGTYAVLDDDQGRLWISTNRGLSRFDPETETFRNYGTEIGLQGLEFNSGSFHRGPRGELFFGGQHGLNSFFPNELNENSNPPEVTLVDLKLFNESIASTGAVEILGSLDKTDQVTFSHDQRDLEFDFVAFHYSDPESNEYAYKLEGWNDDWVHVGTKRTASFTNLDPGEYVFRVKASNSDGVWNEEGASIRVVVTPPFWATWWFRLLGIFSSVALLLGGYRLRTSQLESRAQQLEGEVNARTSELKASNEHLEQSQTIVKAINQETSFRKLLTKILEEARVMPAVEKATAIIYIPDEGVFRIRASSGWDVEAMQNITLTDRQARRRYVADAEEVADDIFVAKNVGAREASDQMAEFGQVASFLVLRIMVDSEVAGYLVFDNLEDPDAFDDRDVEFFERLKEHIQSAFIKTRILEDLQGTLHDLQSTQDRLVQSEKMASLGELTAGIAHEIKNPLNFVNNFAEVAAELAREAKSADSPEALAELLTELEENATRIEHHAKRADGIVENMMQHASGSGSVEPTDINALLEEYATLAYHGFKTRHPDIDIEIEKDFDDSIRKLEVTPQELGKVFLNLLGNAFDALAEERGQRLGEAAGGSVAGPTVSVSTTKSDANVEIRISDNGPGIPDDVKLKIFEPFFTTKPTGSGTGLGLSMSYDIITKGHSGELTVESEPGEGATFIVRLPA